jgi:uncharacterized protein
MDTIRLGRTDLMASRSGFGAIPIQRISIEESTALLRKAYEGGINFFDTAYDHADSEEKIGRALSFQRKSIIIATKTPAINGRAFLENLEQSLYRLKTDYIDIYQFHNPKGAPVPGDGSGLYEAALDAKRKRLIRHIGIASHRHPVALAALESGLYDTLQFPFSGLASDADIELLETARDNDVGFIAMKPTAGGLVGDTASNFAYIRSTNYALPVWGIESQSQLEELLALEERP